MRVIMFSWEYPPKIVGGIARHLYDLAHALTKQGVEVHVITCDHPGAQAEEVEDGIFIYRVTPSAPGDNFLHWVHLLNDAMYARADVLIPELKAKEADASKRKKTEPRPLILHAHDWLAYFATVGLKRTHNLPMVSTIHATEYGRNNGIGNPVQHYINSVEWQLQYESWRVIVCTDFMKRECQLALQTPWDKMDIIYNGVDATKFVLPEFTDAEKSDFRARYALPQEKIIFFVGRMVREKGVQVLIEALPKIRWFYNDAKLVIVGGGNRDHLVNLVSYVGMRNYVLFTGFVPDEDLMKIFSIIDVACFPSLYEPFGIVALEAMASHVPVVVSDAGGLPEVVENGVTGTTTFAGNTNSLADGILNVLLNPDKAVTMAETAYERVQTVFNWDRLAKQTTDVYDRVWSEYLASDWRIVPEAAPAAAPKPRKTTKKVAEPETA